jgi:hypothetical protein
VFHVLTTTEVGIREVATLQVGPPKRRRVSESVGQELLQLPGLGLPEQGRDHRDRLAAVRSSDRSLLGCRIEESAEQDRGSELLRLRVGRESLDRRGEGLSDDRHPVSTAAVIEVLEDAQGRGQHYADDGNPRLDFVHRVSRPFLRR